MARPRKSSEIGKETAKTPMGLSGPPYSARVGGNPYVLYVHYHPEGEDHPRVIVWSFLSLYAAKWFMLRLIGDDDYELARWKYNELDRVAITSRGIHIRSAGDNVKTILDYEFASAEEAEWKDGEVAKSLAFLKWGKWEHKASNDDVALVETPEGLAEVKLSRKEAKKKLREERNRKREADPQKAPRPKVDKSDKVTAGDLAAELKMLPRDFRAVLRKMKMVKPEGGWLFDKADADKIKKQVKDNAK